MSDVPAIYFCQPTEENLQRIAKDLEDNLYGSYYFNFISPISRQKLEDLAQAAIRANAVTQIRKLYDQGWNSPTVLRSLRLSCDRLTPAVHSISNLTIYSDTIQTALKFGPLGLNIFAPLCSPVNFPP